MKENIEQSIIPGILTEALRDQLVWDDQGNRVELDSNVSLEEAILLNAAVSQLKPSLSVEIGLAKGVSTLAILGALENNKTGHHVVIDPFQKNYGNAGIEMVRRSGLSGWWEFHEKFAEEVIPGLNAVQFAFVDASHLFDLTLTEFVLVDKKLEVGGVVGFHDLWMPSLQALFRYIMRNRAYEIWYPAGFETDSPAKLRGWKEVSRRLLSHLPESKRVFAPEFLRPWGNEGLGNLVLLRKRANDARDWRFHQTF